MTKFFHKTVIVILTVTVTLAISARIAYRMVILFPFIVGRQVVAQWKIAGLD